MITGLHHVAISTIDYERSVEWYRDLFGLTSALDMGFTDGYANAAPPEVRAARGPLVDIVSGLTGSTGRQTLLRCANAHIELFEWTAPAPKPRPDDWKMSDHGIQKVCFQVDDVDRWYERLSDLGVTFLSAPQTFPPAKIVYALDPDGNIVELIEPLVAAIELPLVDGRQPADPTIEVEGVHHVSISVPDFDAAMAWYGSRWNLDPLGPGVDFSDGRFDSIWATTGAGGTAGLLKLGNAFLEVFEFHSPTPKPRDPEWAVCDHGFTHFAFQLEDLADKYPVLVDDDVSFTCAPILGGGGRVNATYSFDGDGNIIELIDLVEPLGSGKSLNVTV